ncbi:T3SS (YopN, CesT) and YbjN peptide-binding chaperone 1 [Dietzia sp. MNB45]|uniref:T3SS (YopN, CesT) and YbjN peptide-binding chaperone 1 n=1 Tax=Dietzia sp. MNB45 TaxID=3238800 RepID=UPI003F7F64A2
MGSRRDDGMDGVGGEATECAWGVFLDTLILRIGAVGDGDALALVAPTGPEGWSQQLVVRSDRGRGFMWVTRGIAGSTAAEEVVASAGADGAFALADAIVRVAREDLRLPHPQLFTARASGRGAAELAESLGLADADAPGGPDGRTDGGVRGGPDALRPVVVEAVGRMFGQEPGVDDDGDVYFTVAGTTVFVIFSPDGGLVQAWALVVRGVYSRRNTAVEVDLLNSKGMWSTWYLSGRDVFQRITLPARPLSADNIEGMLRAFAKDLEQNRDELAYRLGGKVA